MERKQQSAEQHGVHTAAQQSACRSYIMEVKGHVGVWGTGEVWQASGVAYANCSPLDHWGTPSLSLQKDAYATGLYDLLVACL